MAQAKYRMFPTSSVAEDLNPHVEPDGQFCLRVQTGMVCPQSKRILSAVSGVGRAPPIKALLRDKKGVK